MPWGAGGGGEGCFLIDEMHCAGQLPKPKREERLAGAGGCGIRVPAPV